MEDTPPKFVMLLSRSWMKKLGGTLQMDMSYVTIIVFGEEYLRLYREVQLSYLISDCGHPTNHLIYAVEQYLGSCILHINDDVTNCIPIVNKT